MSKKTKNVKNNSERKEILEDKESTKLEQISILNYNVSFYYYEIAIIEKLILDMLNVFHLIGDFKHTGTVTLVEIAENIKDKKMSKLVSKTVKRALKEQDEFEKIIIEMENNNFEISTFDIEQIQQKFNTFFKEYQKMLKHFWGLIESCGLAKTVAKPIFQFNISFFLETSKDIAKSICDTLALIQNIH